MRLVLALSALLASSLALPATGWAHADAGRAESAPPRLARLDVPRQLRVVSYYPADAGWTRMWEPWRPARLAADLGRLRSLNANTVRVVVSPAAFGYPEPEPRHVGRLGEFVSLAAAQGLHVQLTLFDWWGDYRDVAGSKRWAAALLGAYIGDPRIAFVELRNELDPRDAAALAWARELVPWTRALLRGRTPVTLSVAARDPLGDLRALRAGLPGASRPDFFDAHYFTGGGEAASDLFRRLRDVVAPTPLWIGELGYPTSTTLSGYAGVPLTPSAQEAAQAHYLRLCFAASRRLGLAAPGIWILDDFAPGALPASDVSSREPEYTFGIFRSDGSPKRAAATVRRLFGGQHELGFNGGFESAVLAADGRPLPAAWSAVDLTGLELARDAAVARTGSASARLSAAAGAAGAGTLEIAPVPGVAAAGRRAEAVAWIRGRLGAGQVRLAVEWFDGAGRRVGRDSTLVTQLPATGWRRYTVAARRPGVASFARVSVGATAFTGVVWVDDVGFAWR